MLYKLLLTTLNVQVTQVDGLDTTHCTVMKELSKNVEEAIIRYQKIHFLVETQNDRFLFTKVRG